MTKAELHTRLALKESFFSRLQTLKSGISKGKNEYLVLLMSLCTFCF